MELTRIIDNSIYSRKALDLTIEVYATYCMCTAKSRSKEETLITIKVHEEFKNYARQILFEFWNYFLDLSCKQILEQE